MDDHKDGVASSGANNTRRVTRKRARPEFLDPSPVPTRKRRRGRPPGSGRRQKLVSWLSHEELEIVNVPRPSVTRIARQREQTNKYALPPVQPKENPSSPTNYQLSEQGIPTNNLPPLHKHAKQIPEMKKEPHDVAVGGRASSLNRLTSGAQEGKEIITAPPTLQLPRSANGREREGTSSLSDQPSHSIDSFLNHVANAFDDTGGGHPAEDRTTVQVCSYAVNPSLAPTLHAIINKHGDIAKDCPLESGFMRTSVLEGICKVVQELQRKELTELDSSHLFPYYSAVKDAQTMKLNVKWLHQRLDEIFEAVKSVKETKTLMGEKTKRMEHIEHMKKDLQLQKVELESFKYEIEVKESQLALETMETEKLISRIRTITTRFQHFQSKSLMDGLL